MDSQEFEKIWGAGQAMTMDQAIELALHE